MGHSSGGVCVTQVVHQFSTKVIVAVYVAANMLRNGFCTEEDIKAGSPTGFKDLKDNMTYKGILLEDIQQKIYYNTSPQEVLN